ncbi:probable folate-biopterin transporter 7 [Olea europaea subsp. europaea]|uniref:Probable folate-biopterin transporter 7 n=1 Tax=Olea europaea subsp. europaea TaxID=158383 RepID=A0A8S0PI78_OLEEU|nr:probable folate-biopterin transporter 7 [Olea europaea subsp. europaea]
MVSVRNGSESERNRKVLLGMGFWVQGLRCFPWMGVNFFLKDGMRVDPSTLQILQNSANLPMVAKPFYGILSDSFYIFGQHRVPYIALGAFLQAVSWITIALFAKSGISFLSITIYLLLGNLGASIVEVANDAIVAETGKQPTSSKKSKPSSSGELQSFVWMASAIGGVLGNLIGGIAIDKFSTPMMFLMFGILLSFQFLLTLFICESSLDLPKTPSHVGFRKQLSELLVALRKPEIYYSIIWFAISYAVIPALTGTMFYYQTQHLKIESSLLGISKVFGQAAMLLWGIVYNRHLKSIPPRKLITAVQVFMSIFVISDALFVNGVYRSIGIPDTLYVMVFSGLLEVLCFFKILPFNVLMAQLCPPGCEGSVMAFVMSAIALAFIVSGYLGVALASYVGVTGDDFSGLPRGLLIQAACTLLPLFWSSCIPDVKSRGKRKEN